MAFIGQFDAGARMGALGESIKGFGDTIQGIKDKARDREMQIARLDQIRTATEDMKLAYQRHLIEDKEFKEQATNRKKLKANELIISDALAKTAVQDLLNKEIKTLSDLVSTTDKINQANISPENKRLAQITLHRKIKEGMPDYAAVAEEIGMSEGDYVKGTMYLTSDPVYQLMVGDLLIAREGESLTADLLNKTPEDSSMYSDVLDKYNTASDMVRTKRAVLGSYYSKKIKESQQFLSEFEKRIEPPVGKATTREETMNFDREGGGEETKGVGEKISEFTNFQYDAFRKEILAGGAAQPGKKILTEEEAFQMEAEEFSDKELRDLYREMVRSRAGRRSKAPAFMLKELERRALAKEEPASIEEANKEDFTLTRPSSKPSKKELKEYSDKDLQKVFRLMKGNESWKDTEAYKEVEEEIIRRGLYPMLEQRKHTDLYETRRRALR